MVEKSYFENMYGDVNNPMVISDIETNEIVFMNKPMEKILKNLPKESTGNKCYEVIHFRDTPCDKCLKTTQGMERFITHEKLNRQFKNITDIIEVKSKPYRVCKYYIYLQDNPEYSFEEAMTDFFDATSKTNMDDVINKSLEIIGKYYNAERSYVYKVNQIDKSLHRQYSWIDNAVDLSAEDIAPMSLNLILDRLVANVDGIIDFNYERSLPTLHELEKKFLLHHKIKNLAVAPIFDTKGTAIAFLGVNNRKGDNFLDARVMKAVKSYSEQNLEKIRLISELQAIDDMDTLTGLYKRKKYSQDVEDMKSKNHGSIGVVFTNINGLKRINAEKGYNAGDKLISKSAEILKEIMPNNTFYRIAGDEFVSFMTDITQEEFEKNIEQLRSSIKEKSKNLLAVGHAFEQGRNIDILSLINNADTLMYINKQEYYHENHNKESNKPSDEILNDLMYAIDNDEFLVYLQPKVKLSDTSIIGAEALIRRFSKKENKMIFPDQFISTYEKSSIIRHVDIFVLEKVCKLLRKWKEYDKQIPISINLSRVTLMEYDIVETVTKVCKKYEIDPKYIVIEITERIGLLENNIASKLITDFKANGFPLSLDDFGCAYSNIVTLAKIDVEEVKIDKSLVDDLIKNQKNRIIVDNILNMCSSFGNTHAVAEGIETEEQARILRDFGCVYGQGYHFSRPMPNEDFFEKYIKN